MRTLVLLLTATLLAWGCQDEAPKNAEPAADPAKTGDEGAPAKAPTGEESAPTPTAGKKAWELAIDGKAQLSGPSVMVTKPSKVATYGLLGGDAMTYVHVEDGKTDAYIVQVGLTSSGQMCMYRADNKQLSKGIEVKLVGDRYTVNGEITCGPVKGPGDKTVHKISGHFEKK